MDCLGQLEKIKVFPAIAYFFRSETSHLNGVTPLIESAVEKGILGVGMHSLSYDVLHTLDLGVTQVIIGAALMLLISSPLDLFRTGMQSRTVGLHAQA